MLRLSDFRFFFTSCTSHYNALCQSIAKAKEEEEDEDDDVDPVNNSRYMYTCRCPDGYGYENCTRVTNNQYLLRARQLFAVFRKLWPISYSSDTLGQHILLLGPKELGPSFDLNCLSHGAQLMLLRSLFTRLPSLPLSQS